MRSQSREKTVGFVGLGMTGSPMAENILKKRHPMVAYTRRLRIKARQISGAVAA